MSWIEQFLEHTETLPSPEIFRKWAAISAIAGVLERKVWVRTMNAPMYPNMYVILVAPPGVGKTEVTWRVNNLWRGIEGLFVAPSSVTKASLIDELADANRRWITNNPIEPVSHFNSLLVSINELGVLIPGYDNEFMNVMTDMWDCKGYSERRRSSKKDPIKIDKPQISMLGGCTPSYLTATLPEGAWDQGFLSRTMLIYSGEQHKQSLFGDQRENEESFALLLRNLTEIGNLYGEIKFSPEAKELIDQFWLTGGEPSPDHPKLLYYNSRRHVHLIKLAMVCSVSRSTELIIRLEDYQEALNLLMEAEAQMPEIFKAMSQGGSGKTIEDCWYFIFQLYNKTAKPVSKHLVIRFLQERVPVHAIEQTLKMMEQSQLIEARLEKTGPSYIPRGKTAH